MDFLDPALTPVWEKVAAGTRLSREDGLTLYKSFDLMGVGRMAGYVRNRLHGRDAFYVYNQHLNYTNICKNQCRFCAFSREEGDLEGAYVYSIDDVKARLTSRAHEPINEIHIVGGINPRLPFSYYVSLLETVKAIRPAATIKAFTAAEIDYLADLGGMSLEDVLAVLKNAGLEMVPGGGAEVLNPRIHQELFPKKINGRRWLEVMETIHRAGITANATLLYGHIETLEERVDHFISLRELQDRTGGFSAFIPLAFHSENTKLSHIPPTTAHDDLKAIAVARLMLDNFPHIKAYWVMIGERLAQVGLSFGADDLDGTIIEEKITHMAGATSAKGLTQEYLTRMIRAAGFRAVERDSFYRPVKAEGGVS